MQKIPTKGRNRLQSLGLTRLKPFAGNFYKCAGKPFLQHTICGVLLILTSASALNSLQRRLIACRTAYRPLGAGFFRGAAFFAPHPMLNVQVPTNKYISMRVSFDIDDVCGIDDFTAIRHRTVKGVSAQLKRTAVADEHVAVFVAGEGTVHVHQHRAVQRNTADKVVRKGIAAADDAAG